MKYYETAFSILNVSIEPYLVHSLITRIFDVRPNIRYGIDVIDQQIIIKTLEPLGINKDFTEIFANGQNVTAEFVKESEKESHNLSDKLILDIGGLLSYGRHEGKKRVCPVWNTFPKGLQNKEHLLSFFKANGFKILDVEALRHPSVEYKKVTVHNIFTFKAKAEVIDVDLAHKTLILGIGQRRSYGFGGVKIL